MGCVEERNAADDGIGTQASTGGSERSDPVSRGMRASGQRQQSGGVSARRHVCRVSMCIAFDDTWHMPVSETPTQLDRGVAAGGPLANGKANANRVALRRTSPVHARCACVAAIVLHTLMSGASGSESADAPAQHPRHWH